MQLPVLGSLRSPVSAAALPVRHHQHPYWSLRVAHLACFARLLLAGLASASPIHHARGGKLGGSAKDCGIFSGLSFCTTLAILSFDPSGLMARARQRIARAPAPGITPEYHRLIKFYPTLKKILLSPLTASQSAHPFFLAGRGSVEICWLSSRLLRAFGGAVSGLLQCLVPCEQVGVNVGCGLLSLYMCMCMYMHM